MPGSGCGPCGGAPGCGLCAWEPMPYLIIALWNATSSAPPNQRLQRSQQSIFAMDGAGVSCCRDLEVSGLYVKQKHRHLEVFLNAAGELFLLGFGKCIADDDSVEGMRSKLLQRFLDTGSSRDFVSRLLQDQVACLKHGRVFADRKYTRAAATRIGGPRILWESLMSDGLESRQYLIFARQQRRRGPPVDGERGIVPEHPEFILGMVVIAALVKELSRLRPHQKAVGKAGRDVNLALIFFREYSAHPSPEAGRPETDVHGHVEYLAAHHPAELALAVLQLVMKAAQCSLCRLGVVVLNENIVDPELLEAAAMIALEEKSARIGVDLRLQ